MKKQSEKIFTFTNCRYWLRFPGATGAYLTRLINALRSDRAGGAELLTKPFESSGGVQTEPAVVDVFKLSGRYEYKLGDIPIDESSVFSSSK